MLSEIISELAADFGIKIADASQRSYLVDKVNKAAQEIWNSNRIRGSEMEQVFEIDINTQQISVPQYAAQVLNVRQHYLCGPIQLVSMTPRYVQQEWAPPFFQWRIVKFNSPIARTSDQVGPLTFTLAEPSAEAFTITVSGRTNTAQNKTETLVVAVGDTSVTGTESFFTEDLVYIKKSRLTSQDVTITDLDGTTISTIYNNQLKAEYVIINVIDWRLLQSTNNYVEVLFKPRFVPFNNDTDVFQAGEIYDRAVYYKTLQYLYEKQDGKEDKALQAYQACELYLTNVSNQLGSSEVKMLKFKQPVIMTPAVGPWNNFYRRDKL